jgi:dihydroorotate dehydrogenase electron transfer subunit
MLKAVQSYANENNIPCQISLEERMACGMGVCLGCAVKDAKQENTYKHVCKNGPVFDSRDVEI